MPTPNPTSPLYAITLLVASQSQPEIIVNQAIRVLEALAQPSIISRVLTAPPGSPVDGDLYMPASGSTGDWSGYSGFDLALRLGTAWFKIVPKLGMQAYIQPDDKYIKFIDDSPVGWQDV
jgi:hypothetical protein